MSAENYLKSIIKAQGPITIAQYMAICLSDSKYGYYTKQEPIGKQGDFITAPEISQMFGELIGIWCATVWQSMGKPESLSLVEFGPGKGTLMGDILRATRQVSDFHDSLNINLVEISPTLLEHQKRILANFSVDVKWIGNISEIPQQPTLFLGNEFFDALPIQQFVKTDKGWRERMVGINEDGNLDFALSAAETPSCALIPDNVDKDASVGSLYELSPASISIMKDISQHIQKNGGAGLFIDYGYNSSPLADSLQAVKNHKYHPVLESPGLADLTAHVDFSTLVKVAKDCKINAYGPIGQGQFLQAMGIDLRASMLLKNAAPDQKKSIITAVNRLTEKAQMGELFKCISVTHPKLPTPQGFEDDNQFKIV